MLTKKYYVMLAKVIGRTKEWVETENSMFRGDYAQDQVTGIEAVDILEQILRGYLETDNPRFNYETFHERVNIEWEKSK